MRSKEQGQEQLKLMYHVLAEQDAFTKAHYVTEGWIHALKWFLEDES